MKGVSRFSSVSHICYKYSPVRLVNVNSKSDLSCLRSIRSICTVSEQVSFDWTDGSEMSVSLSDFQVILVSLVS